MKSVSVVGLGKLGSPMVACFANKGFRVIGVDRDASTVEAINERKPLIYEPGLKEMLKTAMNLSTTTNTYQAVRETDVSFVIVPTPSLPDGRFDTKYIETACAEIARAIKDKDTYHLVSITSTVLPGDTEEKLIPAIETVSGKKCGQGWGITYNPEFIALGSVIRDFMNPDVILIGESDKRAGDLLSKYLEDVCDNKPPIVRMTIRNAELAKISLNAYVTMKITFANVLAELCEKMPTGNVDDICRLLGNDTRIGRKYLSGGLGYGGTCFPRDDRAFMSVAKNLDCVAKVAEQVDSENDWQNQRIVEWVKNKLGHSLDERKISILGLTYKPNTDVVEESASLKIAKQLADKDAIVYLYDPHGMGNALKVLNGDNVIYANSLISCLQDTELCIVATPWDEFKKLTPEIFIKHMKTPSILDCWRIYDRELFSKRLDYNAIGINNVR